MNEPRDFISDKRIYPPANECIYCGARDGPLTDEHTFPDGLGGRHILPKASCASCQKIINEDFEQYCQRTLFANMRAVLGIRGSKKRPPVPSSYRVRRESGEIERVYIEPAEVPLFFALPVFPEPYFLTGEQVTDTFPGAWWKYQPEPMSEALAELSAKTVITETIWPIKLARLVAKISHAHAWALWGPVFEPLLPPIILGKNIRFIEFVGGWVKELPPDPDLNHTIRIVHWRRNPDDDRGYLVAEIRFFAVLGAPVYYAVVGKALRSWPFPERQD